ncbi:prepilin peptidase [uncultured Shimia sp.]|uniref:A24 family peptidase n=1 Tax=uncultured Shimia sp. TaxID=573152 RepID=UPI00263551D1|nr:prepilin peptidase [uncultured Shimia sp.]
MHISATTALWFLIPVAPICFYVFYADMKFKKISNKVVWLLFFVFVVIGLLQLPFQEFLWRFANYAVVFAIGLIMWMARQVGAGDVKFAAVIALFIDPQDAAIALWILFAAIMAATVATLIARYSPIWKVAPDWAAWRMRNPDDPNSVGGGKQMTLPMGTGLGLALCAYLLRGFLAGA